MAIVNEQINETAIIPQNGEFPFPKKEETVTIVEYAENMMETFDRVPFGTVDSLLLSQLAYMNIGCIVPGVDDKEAPVRIADLYKAEFFEAILDDVRDRKSNRKLLNAICCSPRYRDIKVNYFIDSIDEAQEKQFCAMTFILPDGTVYVCFRGTDATIVGWKEDFNMFFRPVIPGQIAAVQYLETVASRLDGDIYVGGHSKGGNLALFAGTFAPQNVRDRIIIVFNHDGPGLSPSIQQRTEYSDITYKVHTTVPQASLFGLIFSNGDYQVVKSDRMGIMQHDPFSWEITGNDFDYAQKVHSGGNKIVGTINEMMSTLSEEDRELFIDTVFKVISSPGATSFTDWPAMVIKEMDSLASSVKSIDPETGERMKTVMVELVKSLGKNMLNLPDKEKIKEFITEKVGNINLPKKI